MDIKRNLIITSTNQRARELKKSITNTFDKVISLDNFIDEIFEKISFQIKISPFIAKSFLYKTIQNESIEYFSYITQDGDALELIFDLFVKLQRNNIDDLSIFSYNEDKKIALNTLRQKYIDFKNVNNFVDEGDIESFVLDHLRTNPPNEFDSVFIDEFEVGTIKFYKSNLQKQIIDFLLEKYKKLEYKSHIKQIAKLYKLAQNPFDVIDETKSALRLVRKLLEENKDLKDEDICIAVSDITQYASLFRVFAPMFDIKVYDSIGLPLINFKNKIDKSPQNIKNIFKNIDNQAKKLKQKAKSLNLEINEQNIKENLIKNTFVLEDKIGIEITETNQLVTLNKTYEHIIFVGADMNHFPMKAVDNFLYSHDQAVKYFNASAYYESSSLHYNHLKSIAKNLYISYPSYNDKRAQSLSILISDEITNEVDISSIKFKLNKIEKEDYIASITSKYFTIYDGMDVDGFEANNLSASQLNAYAKCPLKYLYTYKLGLKAPKEKTEGFDVAEEGTLMHKCFEEFSKSVKSNKLLNIVQMREIMSNVLESSFDATLEKKDTNAYHHAFKQVLARGLDGNEPKGLLAKFVDDYFNKQDEFECFANSEFEKQFALDSDLKPYKLKDKYDREYFIKGFIDRFDNLENGINIVDYKSKKADGVSQDKLNEIKEFKDFQLGLYVLYAKQEYQKEVDAYLLTFKSDKNISTKFARVSTNKELIPQNRGRDTGVLYESEYEANLKEQIFSIKEKIEKGDFCFDSSSEEYCGYCEVKNMCDSGLVNKQ